MDAAAATPDLGVLLVVLLVFSPVEQLAHVRHGPQPPALGNEHGADGTEQQHGHEPHKRVAQHDDGAPIKRVPGGAAQVVEDGCGHGAIELVHGAVVVGPAEDLVVGAVLLQGVDGRCKMATGAEHDRRVGQHQPATAVLLEAVHNGAHERVVALGHHEAAGEADGHGLDGHEAEAAQRAEGAFAPEVHVENGAWNKEKERQLEKPRPTV